jgi:hypothetical protein
LRKSGPGKSGSGDDLGDLGRRHLDGSPLMMAGIPPSRNRQPVILDPHRPFRHFAYSPEVVRLVVMVRGLTIPKRAVSLGEP